MVVNFRLIFFYSEFQRVTFYDLIPNCEGVSSLRLAVVHDPSEI